MGECICRRFRDTGGYRIADLGCPIHGVDGTNPSDGPWEEEPAGQLSEASDAPHDQEPATEHIHVESSWGIAPFSDRGQPTTASDAPHDGETGPEPWPTPRVGELVRLGDDATSRSAAVPYLPPGWPCTVQEVTESLSKVLVSTTTSVTFWVNARDLRPHSDDVE